MWQRLSLGNLPQIRVNIHLPIPPGALQPESGVEPWGTHHQQWPGPRGWPFGVKLSRAKAARNLGTGAEMPRSPGAGDGSFWRRFQGPTTSPVTSPKNLGQERSLIRFWRRASGSAGSSPSSW